jgi:RimJ/RimL family protein N-acetyltransferase
VATDEIFEPIRTSRLELVPIPAAFAQALVDGDRSRASVIIGGAVGRWFAGDSAHVVQLAIASAAEPGMPQGGGRVAILVERTGRRRAIGSVGFHGPPDERGRLEVGCRIDPAYRGRGYAGEAMTAMLEWAAVHLGITRFLVSVSSAEPPGPRLVAELELTGRNPSGDRIAELDAVLDSAP